VFSTHGGHFGLIGMRERAERLGGELRLASNPGEGTEVEVTVPLP
jgi:signal transduction histidine kinase